MYIEVTDFHVTNRDSLSDIKSKVRKERRNKDCDL